MEWVSGWAVVGLDRERAGRQSGGGRGRFCFPTKNRRRKKKERKRENESPPLPPSPKRVVSYFFSLVLRTEGGGRLEIVVRVDQATKERKGKERKEEKELKRQSRSRWEKGAGLADDIVYEPNLHSSGETQQKRNQT